MMVQNRELTDGMVSVIIPTYKRADTLPRAIDSVLNQTYSNIECIVVNDNTKNDEYSRRVYELIKKYNSDRRFHFIEQEKHINGAAARNAGIEYAQGEYIAFLDDDDWWERTKIQIQVQELEKLDSTFAMVTCLIKCYCDGQLVRCSIPYRSGYILMDILLRKARIGMCAALIRRKALDSVGYFDENLARGQDLQLFSQLANRYKVKLIARYLCNQDVSDPQNRNADTRYMEMKQKYLDSIDNVLCELSKRDVKMIVSIHRFECSYTYWSTGKRGKAIKEALQVCRSPYVAYLAIQRIFQRILEKELKFFLAKKYN